MKIRGKNLEEWKEYCKFDDVPIKTMKYITCLEETVDKLKFDKKCDIMKNL